MNVMSDILYEDSLWKILKEEVELPDGRKIVGTRVHSYDAVHILAFVDEKTILLLKEYRPFYGEWVWMLPSGLVDKEKEIEVAAQRELQEETGKKAQSLYHYFSTNQSEHFVRTNHVFVAKGLEDDPLEQDEHEIIEVHEVPLKEAVQGVMENRYGRHMITAYALLRYGMEHGICPDV